MELGKTQNLSVKEFTEFGALLEDNNKETVLLPNKESEGLNEGDSLDVFIYRDSQDRPIATRKKPLIELDQIAPLKVKEITDIGAFLDWGLDKDLLLPFSEQAGKLKENDICLVKCYLDKSDRLAATAKIYSELSTDSPYKNGDWVEGFVYQINNNRDAFIAVDNKYNGMVRKQDLNEDIKVGKTIKLRVEEKRPDGKLTLSPTKKAYKEIIPDARKILKVLIKNKGAIPFNDKSSPEAIRAEFDISKSAFKKALGYLLKNRIIKQTDTGIELLNVKK